MNLVVDIGNSFTKFAFFEQDSIVEKLQFANNPKQISEAVNSFKTIDNTIISSVNNELTETLETAIKNLTKNILIFNYKTKIPIENKYIAKKTLGLDRLAGVIGANEIFPNDNILVFDAGTALTIDFINNKNEYLGGNISPGLQMRFNSLHNYTSKLPLIEKSEKFPEMGKTTEEAIISGIQKGIIYEIDSYINNFKNNYDELQIVFTGGDSFFFEKNLKNTIFVNPNLVLIGLHKVLKFNV